MCATLPVHIPGNCPELGRLVEVVTGRLLSDAGVRLMDLDPIPPAKATQRGLPERWPPTAHDGRFECIRCHLYFSAPYAHDCFADWRIP